LCRAVGLGLMTTIPSMISMPLHWSSGHESNCSAVTSSCIQNGGVVSVVIVTPLAPH
jgi:hypothetical protein